MSIEKAFASAFRRKREKAWDKIYVVVDIHDTILHACYENEETYEYLPYAKQALQLPSLRDGILFDYVNENPEVGNSSFQDFNAKLYFNIGIDDKFGFDPETDWLKVIEELTFTVSPDNVHLEDSYRVHKHAFEPKLKAMRERYPDSLVWKNRSLKSLEREWAVHNALYSLGIFKSRTASIDLNWPQGRIFRLGYALLGTLVWPFIK